MCEWRRNEQLFTIFFPYWMVLCYVYYKHSNNINYLYIYSGEWTCSKLFFSKKLTKVTISRFFLIEYTLFPTLSRQLETTSFFFFLNRMHLSLSPTVWHIQMLLSRGVLLNVPVTMHSQLKQKRSDTRVYRFLS